MWLPLLLFASVADDPCWVASDEGALWPAGPQLGPSQRLTHFGVGRAAHRHVTSIDWQAGPTDGNTPVNANRMTVLGPFSEGPLTLTASTGTALGNYEIEACTRPPVEATLLSRSAPEMGGVWIELAPPPKDATAWVTVKIGDELTEVPAPVDPTTGRFFVGANNCTPYSNFAFPEPETQVELDVVLEDCSGSRSVGTFTVLVQNALIPRCGHACPR
jgi:hypothetical protein